MNLTILVVSTFAVTVASNFSASLNNLSSSVAINVHVEGELIPNPVRMSQKQTAQTFIDAYNAWDIEAILGYRTPDCQHQALPSSMGRLAKSNDEYREYFETIMPLFSNFTVMVHKETHDTAARTCTMHASSTANTKTGTYANEYALFLTFTQDGTKIKKIEEFVDSAYTAGFFAKLGILS